MSGAKRTANFNSLKFWRQSVTSVTLNIYRAMLDILQFIKVLRRKCHKCHKCHESEFRDTLAAANKKKCHPNIFQFSYNRDALRPVRLNILPKSVTSVTRTPKPLWHNAFSGDTFEIKSVTNHLHNTIILKYVYVYIDNIPIIEMVSDTCDTFIGDIRERRTQSVTGFNSLKFWKQSVTSVTSNF